MSRSRATWPRAASHSAWNWERRSGRRRRVHRGALDGATWVANLTEWNEFRALDLIRVKTQLIAPVIVDLKNRYNTNEMAGAGFDYFSIGRPF